MDYKSVIDRYYPEDNQLRHILLTHSQSVMRRALRIGRCHPELNLDMGFLEEASMLHDIGIFRCDAPGIQCFGTEPYICHGYIGGQLLRGRGFPRHARVCERHTGAGITLQEIERQHLPLPHQDFLPETMEEKVICYADKFYSKSHLDRERTVEQAAESLKKFGLDGYQRFCTWAKMFE